MLSVGYISCVPLGTFSSRHPSSSEKICLKRSSIQKTRAVQVRSNLISEGNELIFQRFNWKSHDQHQKLWNFLGTKIPEIAKSGFSSVWLPDSFSPEGYTPQNLYSLNTRYGSEDELRTLLHKMKQYEVRSMADIVINHRCGTTKGHRGMYNRFDVIPLAWDEHAVTSSSGGLENPNTGNKLFLGFPIINHTKEFVRKDILN
ncbi:hypothetical protein VIGAN_03285200 [Vigna angularis var. angularis]|uniref:1,4-alpha-D-glucan glucanohydrolase n=1 Tax=Vigna angularis var. angularis TaxID=157739 RepID=A0A0S3RQD4_PHAAN|nr:hypothetical protein VIGAN_03285200 [Vigna angularis var. angularis]